MIGFTIKLALYFTFSFSILCLPINKRPLFNVLYQQFGEQILETVDSMIVKTESVILPKIVQIIKSSPKTDKRDLPKSYGEAFSFSDKKYTAEEKNLMMKVLDKN